MFFLPRMISPDWGYSETQSSLSKDSSVAKSPALMPSTHRSMIARGSDVPALTFQPAAHRSLAIPTLGHRWRTDHPIVRELRFPAC